MAQRHSSTTPKAHPALTEASPAKLTSAPGVIGGASPRKARSPKLRKYERVIQVPEQAPARWLLRINLEEVKPSVWREFVISNGCTLDKLHEIVQELMGWEDTHLHQWKIGSLVYGDVETDDEDPNLIDEVDVRLRNLPLGLGSTFFYEYDFGDGWRHRLEILEIQAAMKGGGNPVVIKGANCCPPEDCGGPWGYQAFLKAITDPEHDEHESMLKWCGGSFDPRAFDLEGTQIDLQLLALDQNEEQARYLRSVIELETAERARLMMIAWAPIRSGEGIQLESIFKITPEAFLEQNKLLDELIPLLEAQADQTCDAWLRQAILLRHGADGLEVLGERAGDRRPQVWVEWVAELSRQRTPQETLTAAAKALQHLPERHSLRADIAKHAFSAAKQLSDEGAALQARWEGVCSARCDEAVLDLWDQLPEPELRRQWMQHAVEELCTPTPKATHAEHRTRAGSAIPRAEQDWPFDEDDGSHEFGPGSYASFRSAPRSAIALARLLAGDWQAAWNEAKKEPVLGWSAHDKCQALVVAAFFARFARTTLDRPLPPPIDALYRSTQGISALDMLRGTCDCGDRSLEAINRSMSYWAPDLDTGMQAVDLTIRRVDGIVGGLHRNAYDRAALVLCAAVEAMTCLGKEAEGRALMQDVVARHKRKTSFTRALRDLQAKWAKINQA